MESRQLISTNKLAFLAGFLGAALLGSLAMFLWLSSVGMAADVDVTACVPTTEDCDNDADDDCDGDEDCDDSDCTSDPACAVTTTLVCGNDIAESGNNEECDGTDDSACPGNCQSNCQCQQGGGPGTGGCGVASCTAWGPCVGGTQERTCTNLCGSSVQNRSCTPGTSGCGDTVVDLGEDCDDGGQVAGDCCSPSCYEELLITGVSDSAADTTAAIAWNTLCNPSDSVLEWGLDTSYSTGSVNINNTSNYNHTITGLTPGTIYFYRITATRQSQNIGLLTEVVTGSFQTTTGPTPVEICNNGIDDDGDGFCDFLSSVCTDGSTPGDAACPEVCTPNFDCTVGACVNDIETVTCVDLAVPTCQASYSYDQACGVCTGIFCGPCEDLDVNTCTCTPRANCCGNGTCEPPAETGQNCPADCPTTCISNWDCTPWAPDQCPANGLQTRQCVDLNACPLPTNPPDIQRSCGQVCPGLTCANDEEINLVNCTCDPIAVVVPDEPFFIDFERIDEINQRVAPNVALLVLVNTFVSFSWLNLLLLLRYIVTQPIYALFKRKRKKWGIIFNSLTKQPVDLAIVRLFSKENDQLVQSRVTDREGRYVFIVDPGSYYLTVTKPNYIFPTRYLRQIKEDAKYLDIYHGEPIQVKEKDTSITANIPIDPQESDAKRPFRVVIVHYLRKLQVALAFAAVPFALISFAISRTPLTFGLLIMHVILFMIFRRLGYQKRPKSWGIVYDKETRVPIVRGIVRIYDKAYNKLLESRVTDGSGRYSFLVDNNVFYVTADKEGYKTKKSEDINLMAKRREQIVALNLGLEKGVASPPQPQEVAEKAGPQPVVAPPVGKVGIPSKSIETYQAKPEEPSIDSPEEQAETESLEELMGRKEVEFVKPTAKPKPKKEKMSIYGAAVEPPKVEPEDKVEKPAEPEKQSEEEQPVIEPTEIKQAEAEPEAEPKSKPSVPPAAKPQAAQPEAKSPEPKGTDGEWGSEDATKPSSNEETSIFG